MDQFSYEENGRRYINPQVALDEENAFIQNLRDTQTQDNTKIYRDTHNLGTDVASNIGGLNGGEAYFNARFQTPQINKTISDLRATAQAKALSDALANEVAKAKKRYQDAAYAAASGGNGGNSGGDGDDPSTPQHENAVDPSIVSPDSVDTVERRSADPTSQFNGGNVPAANSIAEMTGGSQLPSGRVNRKAYLVSPDGGTAIPIVSYKSVYGSSWSAPSYTTNLNNLGYFDTENQSFFNNKVQNWVNNGWKVMSGPGTGEDLTGAYHVWFSYL